MKYFIFYLLSLTSISVQAKEYFICKEITIQVSFYRSLHIDNYQDFSVDQAGKYSFKIKSKENVQNTSTFLSIFGSDKDDSFLFINDCSKKTQNTITIDF